MLFHTQIDADVGLRVGLNLCGRQSANMWKVRPSNSILCRSIWYCCRLHSRITQSTLTLACSRTRTFQRHVQACLGHSDSVHPRCELCRSASMSACLSNGRQRS